MIEVTQAARDAAAQFLCRDDGDFPELAALFQTYGDHVAAAAHATIHQLGEAVAPVLGWYQSDEHPERPLPEIIADIVSDLQQDRATVLRTAPLRKQAEALRDEIATHELTIHQLGENAAKAAGEYAEEVAALKAKALGFIALWADRYARDFGLPEGSVHPKHYDLLIEFGCRPDAFIRAALTEPSDG